MDADGRARGSTRTSVDSLGRLIATSRPGYGPGQVISLEMVSEEAGVSRAMAREVLQVLQQKRLVRLQPRVGATVLPVERWDVFDPDVIQWRLDLAPRFQMRSLTELRQAIEPTAASLAAQRASADVCRDVVALSQQLQELGEDPRFSEDTPAGKRIRADYQDVDAKFHRAMLRGSQNEMFYSLADQVGLALRYRIEQEWAGTRGPGAGAGGITRFPPRPAPLSLWLHRGLATAIEQGHQEAAATFARAILAEVADSPLPLIDGIALEHALALLDPGSMEAGRGGWGRFQHAIRVAVLSSRASVGALGPIVVMGVAGCGKTTIGQLLAGSLSISYAEADSFHPAGNVVKMAAGTALTDEDRKPWLQAIAARVGQDSRVVVSCSALKLSYRDVLRQADPRSWFLHLKVDRGTAAARVTGRAAHFMPASLVDSQFGDLEPLRAGEDGLTVDGTLPPEQILTAAMGALAAAPRAPWHQRGLTTAPAQP